MRILLLDIETAPHRVYAWGLFDQRIATNQIVEPGYTLCYAAKWLGERGMMFDSVHKTKPDAMFKGIHALLNEADAVCHYNGRKFDIPTLNGEFIRRGMPPPSPYKQIDLLTVCRQQARFASNKLDYVSQLLGLGQKTHHKGMPLWHACMEGDEAAWRVMEKYNRQDVRLLERLHNHLLPWIKNYPDRGVFSGEHCCPKCASTRIQWRGSYYVTRHTRFKQAQCRDCMTWLYEIKGKLQKGLQGWRQAA